MKNKKAFSQFAPLILEVYHRDKEAFWAAVLAPFLENSVSLSDNLRQLKVNLPLLNAFKGLDNDARQTLKEFGLPRGLDITGWKSNRLQYFKDAYPVFAFLAVWMDEAGLHDLVDVFGDILQAGVYAVAGYGILDENVDGLTSSPVEILTSQALIAEYETLALRLFGLTPINLDILHRMRTLFLSAEIKEKLARGKTSPYTLDAPQDCGTKGANSVTPFMLCLERAGKAALIEDYWQVFLLFGAVIQIIDDWQDLEGDLTAGHFSYVTLGREHLIDPQSPAKTARLLREDRRQVQNTYRQSKDMIDQANLILQRLNDPVLERLVMVTNARMEKYFRKHLNLSI